MCRHCETPVRQFDKLIYLSHDHSRSWAVLDRLRSLHPTSPNLAETRPCQHEGSAMQKPLTQCRQDPRAISVRVRWQLHYGQWPNSQLQGIAGNWLHRAYEPPDPQPPHARTALSELSCSRSEERRVGKECRSR